MGVTDVHRDKHCYFRFKSFYGARLGLRIALILLRPIRVSGSLPHPRSRRVPLSASGGAHCVIDICRTGAADKAAPG